MREIKFRGKRIDNGEWVYGFYFETFTGSPMILVMYDHILRCSEIYQVEDGAVGQFTGLFDENGKEIYEGDVLGRQSHWSHYVGFNDGSFVAIPCEKVQEINWVWHPLKQDVAELWEVIGNIHDNPELLEVEK